MGKQHKFKKIIFATITFFFALSLFILLGEGFCRFLLSEYLQIKFRFDERNLTYRYDNTLGWFPIENSSKVFYGCRRITVKHNSYGFRDHEYGEKIKPRIVFLGDSFVWGYDAEEGERFTDRLQVSIPDREILNFGVSGYGTDQEYLLLKQRFSHFKPDVVFLIVNETDYWYNNTNNYHGYYKPYFAIEDGVLTVKGIPVPKSANYYHVEYYDLFSNSYLFRAIFKLYSVFFMPESVKVPDPTIEIIHDMKRFVEEQGGRFFIGLGGIRNDKYSELVSFCQKHAIGYVDLDLENTPTYKIQGCGFHWTPTGNHVVAMKIYDFLVRQGILSEGRSSL